MSYILDALKKAAEQRGATATVLLRPSAPLARGAGAGRASWIAVAAVVVLLNAAALVYLLRPTGVGVPAAPPAVTERAPARPVTAIRTVEEAPPRPASQVIEAEPPRRAAPVKPPVASVKPAIVTPSVPRATPRPASEARATVTEPRVP